MSKNELIQNLPTDHFGNIPSKIISTSSNSHSSVVSGIPGYGMEYLTKYLKHTLESMSVQTLLINCSFPIPIEKQIKKLYKRIDGKKTVIILSEILKPIEQRQLKFLIDLAWEFDHALSFISISDHTILANQDHFFATDNNIFVNNHYITPFSLDKTKWIIESNNNEYNWEIPISYTEKIHKLSGGNPALTKYICMVLYEEGQDLIDHPKTLMQHQPLKSRLQDITRAVLSLRIEQMHKIGLLNDNHNIFSTLVKASLSETKNDPLVGHLTDLSNTEKRILLGLLSNRGRITTKEQISIYQLQNSEEYSEWALYKAIERLRRKVIGVYEIKTVRGKGWMIE